MPWNFWVIWKANNGVEPPADWTKLIKENKRHALVEAKIFNKIEVAAFTIRGERTLRWRINKSHSEYSTKKDCLDVAKKLYAYYLRLKDFDKQIPPKIKKLVSLKSYPDNTQCPLCLEEIEKGMFFLDARKQSSAIQMGHKNPLSKRIQKNHLHTKENVIWQHRRCNYMQGEDTIENALNYMLEILKRHKKI